MKPRYFLDSTAALVHLPEMSDKEFLEAEMKSSLKYVETKTIKNSQLFIMDDIRRFLNITFISREIDEITNYSPHIITKRNYKSRHEIINIIF